MLHDEFQVNVCQLTAGVRKHTLTHLQLAHQWHSGNADYTKTDDIFSVGDLDMIMKKLEISYWSHRLHWLVRTERKRGSIDRLFVFIILLTKDAIIFFVVIYIIYIYTDYTMAIAYAPFDSFSFVSIFVYLFVLSSAERISVYQFVFVYWNDLYLFR